MGIRTFPSVLMASRVRLRHVLLTVLAVILPVVIGGLTQTHSLQAVSSPVEVNPIVGCNDKVGDPKPTDHRSLPASQGSPCDNEVLKLAVIATGSISGRAIDQNTGNPPEDNTSGQIDLDAGWHKFVYRQEEIAGTQSSRAAFKAPGDLDWRVYSTAELDIRIAPDTGAVVGITLKTRMNNWGVHPATKTAGPRRC